MAVTALLTDRFERRTEMGVITNDMRRLRTEVDALRAARGALMEDLALGTQERRNAVSMMQARFRKTHRDAARKARNARVAFVTGLAADVTGMIADFHKSRAEMAKRDGAERLAFVLDQKRSVADMRQNVAVDLAGAHRFWFGPCTAEMRAHRHGADARRHQQTQAEHKAGENALVHFRLGAATRETAKAKPRGGRMKMKGGAARSKRM
jgi:hypothetical protein